MPQSTAPSQIGQGGPGTRRAARAAGVTAPSKSKVKNIRTKPVAKTGSRPETTATGPIQSAPSTIVGAAPPSHDRGCIITPRRHPPNL